MCAGSIDFDEGTSEAEEMEHVIGLIPGHIYSLISALEFKINGKMEKVVKLRNPWGDHEWKGDLCDSDKIWNTIE